MLPTIPHEHIFGVSFCEADAGSTPAFVLERDRASGVARLVIENPNSFDGPWHFIGCPAAWCTVHVGGGVGVYFMPRTLIRLTDPARSPTWSLHSNGQVWHAPLPERIEFGCGRTAWLYTLQRNNLQAVRIHRSIAIVDSCTLALTVMFEGLPGDAEYEESWNIQPLAFVPVPFMGYKCLPSHGARARERFVQVLAVLASRAVRFVGLRLRRLLSHPLGFDARPAADGVLLIPRRLPRWCVWGRSDPTHPTAVYPMLPLLSFSSAAHQATAVTWSSQSGRETRVTLRARLESGAQHGEVSVLIRFTNPGAEMSTKAPMRRPVTDFIAHPPWLPPDPGLKSELLWHVACLRQLAVQDDYFERAFVTQGSAYLFAHGVHGAPRDYAIAAVALVPFDPQLARSTIETMMLMTRSDGAMFYLHTGYGWCSGAFVHQSPSDLPIFLLWAISEYVEQTGDRDFLDLRLPFYPKHKGKASTVRDRIALAFHWLRNRLGTGPHQLLRVGSGDWMDPIALMVKNSRQFHRTGESGLNSAFAVHALRRAAALVVESHPLVAQEMRHFAQELKEAMERQWTGSWFLRGWDGTGRPLGHEHLFADVQAFSLIARIRSTSDRQALGREVYRRLIEPSPIGACILDRPHWTRYGLLPPGWDCNGGVWPAINAFLCWGLALDQPDLARALFHKLRLQARAQAYPHIWYGLWSGPDSFNAHYAHRPGETFHLPATPMDEFPVMNSNWHAAPLLAWQKLKAAELSGFSGTRSI